MRYFTLAEAERILPQVERFLREALSHRAEANKADGELRAVSSRIRMSGGLRIDPGSLLGSRARRDSATVAMKEALEQIEHTGAVIKDIDIGLIDFMSRFKDQDVCLCWKLGEQGIGFWHGADEGFRGRKPIDGEFIAGHTDAQAPEDAGGPVQ